MPHIPVRILGALVLIAAIQADLSAQSFGATLGVAAEGVVGGGLVSWPGPSIRFMLGGRSKHDVSVNGGVHYWRPDQSGRHVALLTFLGGVNQVLGPKGRAWRPLIGGRLEYGLYDLGSEPYGAGEWGLELGIEHRLGGGALQILVLPSYLTLVDGQSNLVLGLEVRVTHRTPD